MINQKWVSKDGSIFVLAPEKQKSTFDNRVFLVNRAIAFNVGQQVAEHIVSLHNKSLEK